MFDSGKEFDSLRSLKKYIYENTTISVHSILQIHVERISQMKFQRLNSENSDTISLKSTASSHSDILSVTFDQSDENIVAKPIINEIKFITQPTINPIQNRFQKTLHHFVSERDVDTWKSSLVNASLSIADMSQKVAFVHLYIVNIIIVNTDIPIMIHHRVIISDCNECDIIVAIININPHIINNNAGMRYTYANIYQYVLNAWSIILKPYGKYCVRFTCLPDRVSLIVFIIAICTGMSKNVNANIYNISALNHSEISIGSFWLISHAVKSSNGTIEIAIVGMTIRNNTFKTVMGSVIENKLFLRWTIDCSTLSTKFAFGCIMAKKSDNKLTPVFKDIVSIC